jgi:hypothetical protein
MIISCRTCSGESRSLAARYRDSVKKTLTNRCAEEIECPK